MNYRHAFHAGNHADVLKHIAVLALCDALTAKPAAAFALDTHAGRGLYALDSNSAQRTGEAEGGIGRLMAEAPKHPAIARYLTAIRACRHDHGPTAYPGSPWLLAHALREQDRIAACELHPEEAGLLESTFARDSRIAVHERDGYAAMKALLPPRTGTTRLNRGLVLIDPPFEAQLEEFDAALGALRDALTRWPQGMYAFWYPIKLRRSLQPFYRRAATLPAKSSFVAELLVRADDSPLRMNGSGLLILNPPWQFDQTLAGVLPLLAKVLGEDAAAGGRVEWLKRGE
ncbi:23S rRNA (adenine(2030)-N(6))-methyltransferase RlmJ [Lysobacter auxotrophicus]|uniref:Ribosomal RNA large subunit methyltransferase J n=1 Tax=Lysobacter auxotrophicus TaxID=2992573 RepID=A0ABM8DFC7_9GAMM|nr:23S rRNA (adenine(2030)-N(6))-methyltransferase RlmJ [Lysobacter auxotrophicus]BDU17299.1 23S rRNA (adenine(2030)-N(6))-methyltransferase RlmJ [Lysobacter auxotrophicus]